LSALGGLFLNNLFPTLLAAATGYILGKTLDVDPKTLSRIIFYILSPCLIFGLFTSSELTGGDIFRMTAFFLLNFIALGLFIVVVGRLLKFPRPIFIAILLTTLFMNAGNYGLPVNLFAFGEPGLAQASVFFVLSGIMIYTVGVLIASLGSYPLTKALTGLLKIPMIYALALAFLFLRMDWVMPLPFQRTIDLLGQAAIPAMLILLGLQLGRLRWAGNLRALALTVSARLVLSPILAVAISLVLGLQGTARQAGILEAAMPTAVMTTVLATEYNVEPAFVTAAVFVSTILSPFTLTPLLAYLGA
jgi:predicted permease